MYKEMDFPSFPCSLLPDGWTDGRVRGRRADGRAGPAGGADGRDGREHPPRATLSTSRIPPCYMLSDILRKNNNFLRQPKNQRDTFSFAYPLPKRGAS